MFYIRMNANPLISSAHWVLTVKGSEKWAMIIRCRKHSEQGANWHNWLIIRKQSCSSKARKSKFKKNKAAPMWNFPQHNSTFHPLLAEGSTPRVWGLALLFTIWVAVHGSNFLIKAPRASSETPRPTPTPTFRDYLLGPEVQISGSEDSRWAKVIHGFPVGHANKGQHSSRMPLLKSAATEK